MPPQSATFTQKEKNHVFWKLKMKSIEPFIGKSIFFSNWLVRLKRVKKYVSEKECEKRRGMKILTMTEQWSQQQRTKEPKS
jgi:hypothetical protein